LTPTIVNGSSGDVQRPLDLPGSRPVS